MKTILIIEDDLPIAKMIKMHISFAGYEAVLAPDGERALVALEEETFDLVILDLMLPYIDGEKILEILRERDIPVIVVSAKSSLVDRVRLLRAGADDYIVKPFESADLIARIEAVLRRSGKGGNVLKFKDIVMDLDNHSVCSGNHIIDITPKEFELLRYFLENQNRVLNREQLSAHVWGQAYLDNSRTVEIHVQRLRRKMGLSNDLRTISKVGYILEDKEN